MTNLAHEMESEITAKELAKREKVSVRAIGIPYAKLRAAGHELFASQFDCNAPLSPEQIAILRPGKFTAKKTVTKKENSVASFAADTVAMTPEAGPSNETAPQGIEVEKEPVKWVEVSALVIAFLLPTMASAFNTYHVSHYLSKDWRIAMFAMCTVTFTPLLFIVARMGWAGVLMGIYVVMFEGFCNASATYLSLMGNMQYILDGKRGQCSDFLQGVVDLTNSDHRPTAVLLGMALAVLFAGVQLISFWTIRKRF